MFVHAVVAITAAAMSPSTGLATSFAACETWVRDPASHAEGATVFLRNSGLDRAGLTITETVPEVAEVPEMIGSHGGLHRFRIDFVGGVAWLTVSDVIPACHFAALGDAILSTPLEEIFERASFAQQWSPTRDEMVGDTRMRTFRWTEDPDLFFLTTYRTAPGPEDSVLQVSLTMGVAGTHR